MAPTDASRRYEYLGAVIWDEGRRPGNLYRDHQNGELLFTVPVSLLPADAGAEAAIRWFRQRMAIPGWMDAISFQEADPNDRDPSYVFGLPDSPGAWAAVRNLRFVSAPGSAPDGDDDVPPRPDAGL